MNFIASINPVAFNLFGRPIYWYGILIASAVLIGMYLAMDYAKKLDYDPELIIDFCLLAIPVSIVCARIYYVAFEWDVYKDHPVDVFKIWEGGIAIYGAVIGGVIAAIIFSKWRKVPFQDILDMCTPSLILGQCIGRWGNFFNQEAYGYAITNPKWQWFPAAVFIEANQQWHMATFFYESMWDLIVFIILMLYRKKRKASGEIFVLYLILYSCGRVVIEGLRTDSLYWGPFRVSQVLSGLLIIFGLIWFAFIRRKKINQN
ncbi:MAG: prolipoprotein diacylglyceryl transferase [Xylanivirga thermophila]|jgi:phosphatidylglycerol---prolipoprotein diacylglyceryl transferase|uniref:prolipoprotein diacylglyceryl transferase n=1 Tax=Xylanivirga thermophila TaxID=2496273 RepID=UPI00101BC609|nr:prolipoprotein diacylglyceryl transferase [Xylanivirga thermophila]